VCELVPASGGRPSIPNLTDSDILHSLRTEVQRLHGDYGLAVMHLSLRGTLVCLFACRGSQCTNYYYSMSGKKVNHRLHSSNSLDS